MRCTFAGTSKPTYDTLLSPGSRPMPTTPSVRMADSSHGSGGAGPTPACDTVTSISPSSLRPPASVATKWSTAVPTWFSDGVHVKIPVAGSSDEFAGSVSDELNDRSPFSGSRAITRRLRGSPVKAWRSLSGSSTGGRFEPGARSATTMCTTWVSAAGVGNWPSLARNVTSQAPACVWLGVQSKRRVPRLNVAPAGRPLATYVSVCPSASSAVTWNPTGMPSLVLGLPTGRKTGAWFSVVTGSSGSQNTVSCFSTVGVGGFGAVYVVVVAPLNTSTAKLFTVPFVFTNPPSFTDRNHGFAAEGGRKPCTRSAAVRSTWKK